MLEQKTPTNATAKLPFYISKNFGLLWVAQAISEVGNWAFETTLILWISNELAVGQAWSPIAVSGVFLAFSLPVILVGTFAGVFADRWKKRPTMLWMDALRAGLVFLILPLSGLVGPTSTISPVFKLAIIYTLVFIESSCAQFFNSSRPALIVDIVPKEYRGQASGSLQITFNFAIIVGPALASLFVFGLGVAWAVSLNALSFIISFGLLAMMRVPPEAGNEENRVEKNISQEWREGYRFFITNPVLKTILITIVLIVAGLGAAQNLNVFFVTRNLHASPEFYGYVSSMLGVGLLIGAIVTTRLIKKSSPARIFWVSVLAMGLFQILYAQQKDYYLGLPVFFLIGIPNGALNASIGPMMIETTPRNLLGRTASLISPIITITTLLSNVLAGYIYSLLGDDFRLSVLNYVMGPLDTIFTVVGLFIIVAGVYARRNLTRYYHKQS